MIFLCLYIGKGILGNWLLINFFLILSRFTVMLTDMKGNLVENTNRIPLTIGIYTSENPPKFIDSNTAGKYFS